MSGDFVWHPDPEAVENSNMAAFMAAHGIESYAALVARSDADPDWFWNAIIETLATPFATPYERVLDLSDGVAWPKWCVGGETNLCYNAVDRHLADRAEQKAIVWISSELGKSREREPGDLSTHEDPAAIEGVGKAIKSGGPA